MLSLSQLDSEELRQAINRPYSAWSGSSQLEATIMSVVRKRISPALLEKAFKLRQNLPQRHRCANQKVIFQRSELFFNDKPAVMVNLRAVEEEENFSSDLLNEVCQSFPVSLLKPLKYCEDKIKTLMD